MNLAKFCKSKGFTIEEYKNLENNIEEVTKAVVQQIPPSRRDNGMYYPITELIPYNCDSELRPFYIAELKKQGIEFIENNTLWRI